MYDPTNAKFISEDPLGFEAEGTNLSAYVLNNPINYTDPYGEDLYDVLNTADQVAAGFADVITAGRSTQLRNRLYREQASRNHQGGWFRAGQGLGVATSLATGFNTPGNIWNGLSWAQRTAQVYNVGMTGVGAYDSTRNIIEGCATPLDALNFLPAIGYGLNRLRGLNNVDDAAKALDNTADAFGDTSRGLDSAASSPIAGNTSGIGNAGFDDINPGYQPNQLSNPRNINCVNCAIATDRTLAGYPSSALPANNGASSILDLEDLYNNQFNPISNPADIVDELQQAGEGARGIVYGERIDPTRGLDGHVFNAVNNGGNITFIDGQNNSFVTDFSGFSDLGFLRTN